MLVVRMERKLRANLKILKLTTAWKHSKQNRSQCCAILKSSCCIDR
jgi:hypothetical protein